MNDVKNYFNDNEMYINSIREFNHVKILNTNKGKYVLKNKTTDNNLYKYLLSKNFNYIINSKNIDKYELFPFVEEVNIENGEKAIELMLLLSLLHNKTTFYRESNLDKIKELYEELEDRIKYLDNYYHELQDIIEQKVYMSPAEYLLIRNASYIYSALEFSKYNLEKWYEEKIKLKNERVVLLHNNPNLDHILIGKEKKLISWNNYKKDIPIYDFITFYRKEYLDLDMISLFQIYKSRFQYTNDEYLLFLSLISIPEKIEFTSNNYLNTYKVNRIVKYVIKTRDFVLNEDKNTKSNDKNKLDE